MNCSMKPLILLVCLFLCVSAEKSPFKCSAYPTLSNKDRYGSSTLCALEQLFLFQPKELTARKELLNKEKSFYEDKIARVLNDNYYHIWKSDSKFASSGTITFHKVLEHFDKKMHANDMARFVKYDEAFKEVIIPKVNEFNIVQFNKLNEEEKDLFLQFLILEIRLNLLTPIFPVEIPTKLFGMTLEETNNKAVCYDNPCVVTLTDGYKIIRSATVNMLTNARGRIQISSIFRDNEILSFTNTDSLVFQSNTKEGSGFLMIVNFEVISSSDEYIQENRRTKRHSLKTVKHPQTEKINTDDNRNRKSLQLKSTKYEMDEAHKVLLALMKRSYPYSVIARQLIWSSNRDKHGYEYLLLDYDENVHRIRHTQVLIRHELTYYTEVLEESKKVYIPNAIPGTKGEQYYILDKYDDRYYIGYKQEKIPDKSLREKDSDIHITGPPVPDKTIKKVITQWMGHEAGRRYQKKFMNKPKEPDFETLKKEFMEKYGAPIDMKTVEQDYSELKKKLQGVLNIKSNLMDITKKIENKPTEKKKSSHLMKKTEEEKKMIPTPPKLILNAEKKESVESVKRDSRPYVNDGFHTPKKKKIEWDNSSSY